MSAQNAYLVLQGGRVLDPASGLDAVADVVVQDGAIVEVGVNAGAKYPGAQIKDVSGHLVTPALPAPLSSSWRVAPSSITRTPRPRCWR